MLALHFGALLYSLTVGAICHVKFELARPLVHFHPGWACYSNPYEKPVFWPACIPWQYA